MGTIFPSSEFSEFLTLLSWVHPKLIVQLVRSTYFCSEFVVYDVTFQYLRHDEQQHSFNVDINFGLGRQLKIVEDREVMRPHALGAFDGAEGLTPAALKLDGGRPPLTERQQLYTNLTDILG